MKGMKKTMTALLIVTFFSFVALAQNKEANTYKLPVDYSPIIAKLKEQLPQQLVQSNVPGLAIAMVDGDKLIWAEGVGYTDRTNQTKVTPDTMFYLASVSKTYTAGSRERC
jgi:CubicO group peptidase (beta-lactamase class C family)